MTDLLSSNNSFFLIHQENPAVSTVAVFLATIVIMFFAIVKPYLESKTPMEGVPMAPYCHWFFGHIQMTHNRTEFPESYLKVHRHDADDTGRTAFWLLNRPCLSLIKVPDVRQVLAAGSYRQPVPILSHYISKVVGKKNLLFLMGREWKQNRDAVTRTFVHSFLVQSQQDVWQVTQDLIVTLQLRIDEHTASDNGNINVPFELDMLPVMKMLTSDVFGKAAFSEDFECCKRLQVSSVVAAFEYIMKDMTRRTEHPLMPWNYFFEWPSEFNRKVEQQLSFLRGFIQNLLSEARIKMKDLDKNLSPKNNKDDKKIKISLVDRLVVAHDSSSNGGTGSEKTASNNDDADQVLIDVISTLLVASYDTTSTTLSFALYLLANHPEIQEHCWKEVDLVASQQEQDNDIGPPLSDPDELVYCKALVQEALRLYPPAAVTGRTLTKPCTLADGHVVPTGVHCVIPIWAIHRDERIFLRPSECLPERWCEPSSSADGTWVERSYNKNEKSGGQSNHSVIPAGNPDALIPFSVGARNCPGAKFAMNESVIALANLVHNFKFAPVPEFELNLHLAGPLPYSVNGMPLRIQKRC